MDAEKLFNLCASVAAGGAHQRIAPPLAVPQRMLSTLSEIAEFGASECGDGFLASIPREIREKLNSKATEEELYDFLEVLSARLATEARRRHASQK